MYSNGWLSAARTVRQTTNECAGGEDLESGSHYLRQIRWTAGRYPCLRLDGQLQIIPGLTLAIVKGVIYSCQTPQLRHNAALYNGHRYRANGELKFNR